MTKGRTRPSRSLIIDPQTSSPVSYAHQMKAPGAQRSDGVMMSATRSIEAAHRLPALHKIRIRCYISRRDVSMHFMNRVYISRSPRFTSTLRVFITGDVDELLSAEVVSLSQCSSE